MKLYFAPNTRAVRTAWLLNELGVAFEIERFELGSKAMRSPEFTAINPNGRVPVLEDGEVRISESTAIAQYLVARYGEGRFAPDVFSPEYPVYLQWLHYGEGMIMPPINNYVVETILLPPERRSEEHANRALRLLRRLLQAVDVNLMDREFLAGDFSAADTITGHACYISDHFKVDISEMPNIIAYIKRLKARPAFQQALAL